MRIKTDINFTSFFIDSFVNSVYNHAIIYRSELFGIEGEDYASV
jgi:hypothetical protein